MSTLARREKEKLQRRNDILEAAEELFDEKGFESATIAEIARKTELSKGTIYLYFQSKDELLLAVCVKGIAGFREELEDAARRKRGLENKIKSVYLAYIEFFLEVPHVFRVLHDTFTERLRSNLSQDAINLINWTIVEAVRFGSQFVQQGIDSGLFRADVDPYAFSVVAWQLATSLIDLAILNDPGVIDRDLLEEMFSRSIELLLDGLKAKAPAARPARKPAGKTTAR
jgi:TetR/AcrR family transcriptional regulator